MRTVLSALCLCLIQSNYVANPQSNEVSAREKLPMISFPDPVNSGILGRHAIKLTARTYDVKHGAYKTIVEYADLFAGKTMTTTNTIDGWSSIYSDIDTELYHEYQPYSCKTFGLNKLISRDASRRGLWNYKAELQLADRREVEFPIHGLLAIWMNALEREKSFRQAKETMKQGGGVVEIAEVKYIWCVDDSQDSGQQFCLTFVDDPNDRTKEHINLERIEIRDLGTKKAVEEYQIVSYERIFSDSDIRNVISPPVGFGCDYERSNLFAPLRFPTLTPLGINSFEEEDFKLQLEVSITNYFDKSALWSNGTKPFTHLDTMFVEIAAAKHQLPLVVAKKAPYQLVRVRNTFKDLKVITDHNFGIQYHIRIREGTCTMRNLDDQTDRNQDDSRLFFSNSHLFDKDLKQMDELFGSSSGFNYVKMSQDSSPDLPQFYFEKTSSTLFPGLQAHIVRLYSSTRSISGFFYATKLHSVSIVLLDKTGKNIKESVHFRVIDIQSLTLIQSGKVFDISEECYLNNELMIPGRDYSWFQIEYNIPTARTELVLSNQNELMRIIRTRLAYMADLDFFRAPRVEMIHEPDGFRFRVLALDYPSIEYRYSLQRRKAFEGDSSIAGLQFDVAVDIKHCVELCRLHQCEAMSFCLNGYSCIISSKWSDKVKSSIVTKESCMLYMKPSLIDNSKGEQDNNLPLTQLMSYWNSASFSDFRAPEFPEELFKSPVEYFTSFARPDPELEKNYYKILSDYEESFNEEVEKLPPLLKLWNFAPYLEYKLVVFQPHRFQLESSQLSKLGISQDDTSIVDKQRAEAAFHTGNPMRTFDLDFLKVQKVIRWKIIENLSFDQCALACLDEDCNSFSHCNNRKNCIITNATDIGDPPLVKYDKDCFVMRREYLNKFRKYSNIRTSGRFEKKLVEPSDPTQCAFACLTETNFRCLSFDYCVSEVSGQPTECFFHETRNILLLIDELGPESGKGSSNPKRVSMDNVTNCDHYDRSYLADFLHLHNQALAEDQLPKIKTSSVELSIRSPDGCAEVCINKFSDCSAFQFCLNIKNDTNALQECILVQEGLSTGYSIEFEANRIVPGSEVSDKIPIPGSLFEYSTNCHIFVLRQDSSRAASRPEFVKIINNDELEKDNRNRKSQIKTGLSLMGGLILFLLSASTFSLLIAASCYVKNNNSYLKHKYDNVQILLKIR